MMPLVLDNRALSAAIRAKKKKLATSAPEMIGTSPVPDYNAQDIYDAEQHARVEETLGSPQKINSDEANLDLGTDVGVTPEEMGRMERLRNYIRTMKLSSPSNPLPRMK